MTLLSMRSSKLVTVLRRASSNVDVSWFRLLIPLSLVGIVVEYLLLGTAPLLVVGLPLWLLGSALIWLATKT